MAVTMELLCGFLDEEELRYAVGRDGQLLYVPFGGCTVRIYLCEEGEGLSFQAPHVFNLADCPRRAAALKCMAEHVYNTKIGHFGYDPRDGEVDVSHFFPVEDGTLTKQQFLRLLHVTRQVATQDVQGLRQAAFGGKVKVADDDKEFELDDDDDGEDDESLADEEDDEAEAAVGELPPAPVDERTWLAAVADTFNALCGESTPARAVGRLRATWWPKLAQLREASAAEHVYHTLALAAELALEPEVEGVLLFMLARQRLNDVRISAAEIEDVLGRSPETVIARLLLMGVLSATDRDGLSPYRLGHRYLDALTEALPFSHTPLPPPLEAASLPAAPMSEAAWLKLVHRAVHAHAADADLPERLAALHDELWPRIRALRAESLQAGEAYATARLAERYALGADEELLVALCACRAAAGDRRIRTQLLERALGPEGIEEHAEEIIDALLERDLLAASDHDGLAPFTIGAAAAEAYGV
jgi:hypothetical protein